MDFGLIIIGDELLSGKRADRHMPRVIDRLASYGYSLGWVRILADDGARLQRELAQTMAQPDCVLCFGGIGATPDDCTREAAARAAGVELVRHPEAVGLIEARFGAEAYPNRILMADLPAGALLIPNEFSGIPGFSVARHHFFPGFPVMAWPMLDQVLAELLETRRWPLLAERAVWVEGVPESALIDLMQATASEHPSVRVFSLPHIEEPQGIELGVRGSEPALSHAFDALEQTLRARRIGFTVRPPGAGSAQGHAGGQPLDLESDEINASNSGC